MNQKTFTTIMTSFNENRNSHAFLMETNNIEECLTEIKKLIFNINNITFGNFNEENIADIKIVEADGKEIKRDQINDILEEFQTFPVFLKHRYYIIVESEKMNQSAANTILKFLEEPDGDIIGFFITSNKGAMINTIVSRCQHYKLFFKNDICVDIKKIEDFINSMNSVEIYKKLLFLNSFFEKDRIDNVNALKEIKYYLMENKNMNNIQQIKKLVKRVQLLDNIIEKLLKNANQELIILDLARNWK